MKPRSVILAIVLAAITAPWLQAQQIGTGPISLDPIDPHYLNYQGKQVLLAGYYPGIQALIAAPQVDPDDPLPPPTRYYQTLIDTLTDESNDNHINLLRVVLTMGMALEEYTPGHSPDWLHPYQRSGRCCTNHSNVVPPSGNRFNLDLFNQDFFDYWDAVIDHAESAGLIVQVAFFDGAHHRKWKWDSNHVNDPDWPPLHHLGRVYDYFEGGNNDSGLDVFDGTGSDSVERRRWYEDAGAEVRQRAFIDKAVMELGDHDNVIWEIINEAQVDEPTPSEPSGGHPWFTEMRNQIRDTERAWRYRNHLIMPFDSPDHRDVAGHRTPGTTSSGSSAETDADYLAVRAGLVANFHEYVAPIIADNDCCPIPGSPEKLRKKAWTSLVSGASPSMLVYSVTGSTSPLGLGHPDTRAGIRYTGYVHKLLKERQIVLRGMIPRDDLVQEASPGESVEYVWALAGDWAPNGATRQQYIVYFFRPGRARIDGLPATYQSWWFDPISGDFVDGQTSGDIFDTDHAGANQDWVLYIDGGVDVEPQTITLDAVADSYVDEANPTTNMGNSSRLSVSYSPTDHGRFSFLRFNIPSFSGSVTSAQLMIRTRAAPVTQSANYEVHDMTWSETAINWLNWDQMGAVTFTYLSTNPTLAANSWHNIDVTSVVTGSGILNLGLASGADVDGEFYSRETAYKPRLNIQRAGYPNMVVYPEADAFVAEDQPTTNFGTVSYLRIRVDPPHAGRYSFIKFQVPPYSGTLQSAVLRLKTQWTTIPTLAVYRTFGMESFNEATINWLNWDRNGAVSYDFLSNVGPLAGNTWHEIDVTNGGAEPGTLVLGLTTVEESSSFNFWSSEAGSSGPELVITYLP